MREGQIEMGEGKERRVRDEKFEKLKARGKKWRDRGMEEVQM